MNKEWSEKAKQIHVMLGKEKTFNEGIEELLKLRAELFQMYKTIYNEYPKYAFSLRPFPNVTGYHKKTLAYSVWHVFRIEDIVSHELVGSGTHILNRDNFLERIGSPIITTGNEIEGEALETFSKALNIDELYNYATAVYEETNEILKKLTFRDMKRRFTEEDKERIRRTGGVSEEECAVWLIDYWCNQKVIGLLHTPFMRHWIMHLEAMIRIKNKLCKNAR